MKINIKIINDVKDALLFYTIRKCKIFEKESLYIDECWRVQTF